MVDAGVRLNETIKNLGLTREEFAALCGVSRAQLYRYLSDEQMISSNLIINMQRIFKDDVDMFWIETGTLHKSYADSLIGSDDDDEIGEMSWESIARKNKDFEEKVSILIALKAMKEIGYVLTDAELTSLNNSVLKKDVERLLETTRSYVSMFKNLSIAKEKENNELEKKKKRLEGYKTLAKKKLQEKNDAD